MKKTILAVIAAALALMTLVSCTNGGSGTGSGTTSGTPAQSKPADSDKDTGTKPGNTSVPDTTQPPETTPPVKVEVGTVLNYKNAFYLDEATPSSGDKFGQNISQD